MNDDLGQVNSFFCNTFRGHIDTPITTEFNNKGFSANSINWSGFIITLPFKPIYCLCFMQNIFWPNANTAIKIVKILANTKNPTNLSGLPEMTLTDLQTS